MQFKPHIFLLFKKLHITIYSMPFYTINLQIYFFFQHSIKYVFFFPDDKKKGNRHQNFSARSQTNYANGVGIPLYFYTAMEISRTRKAASHATVVV